MKKFTKFSVYGGLICLGAGFLLMFVTGFIGGANLVRDLSISIGDKGIWHWEVFDHDAFDNMFDGMNKYALPAYGDQRFLVGEDGIRSLKIAVKGGRMEIIRTGNVSDGEILVSVESSRKNWYAIDDDGTLVIGADTHLGRGNYGKIVIELGMDVDLEKVEVDLGGGEAEIGSLEADRVDIKLGAGEMAIDSITASELFVEVGAGELILPEIAVSEEINIDVGMGELEVYIREKSRKIDIKCGMGETTCFFAGEDALRNYNYDVTCGAGEITIGNQNMGGVGMHRTIDNGASCTVSVDCGMGEVNILED